MYVDDLVAEITEELAEYGVENDNDNITDAVAAVLRNHVGEEIEE